MEKLVQTYSGEGKLIFEDNESATVRYSINEFRNFTDSGLPTTLDRRGRVTNAEGHPAWHPIILSRELRTLVLSDERKLKVLLTTSEGDFQAMGDFF